MFYGSSAIGDSAMPLLDSGEPVPPVRVVPLSQSLPVVQSPAVRTPSLPPLIRAADFAIALAALIFAAPLMLLVALAVWLEDRSPALFAQRRLGRGGSYFGCLKFRSMAPDAEARLAEVLHNCPAARREWEDKQKLTHDPRITRVGAFIRRTSLDELPQLFNVLRGDMSLVGPRPITDSERARYGRYYDHYCSVVPGITGLWQISGRTGTTYQRRVALDVIYIRRRGAMLYFAILVRTVPSVLMARGAI